MKIERIRKTYTALADGKAIARAPRVYRKSTGEWLGWMIKDMNGNWLELIAPAEGHEAATEALRIHAEEILATAGA